MKAALAALAALAVIVLGAAPAKAEDMALTFDDLPAHSAVPPGQTQEGVVRAILAALDARRAPATGFVNGAHLERDPTLDRALAAWRRSGRPLANHTFSHPRLDEVGPAAFQADALRNEPLLERHMPQGGWRWFRFPYLNEGSDPAARNRVRGFLKARGYRIASVTLDFSDWAFSASYARCAALGDQPAIAEMERLFLEAAKASLDGARVRSEAVAGRRIPLVLLLHGGAFTARMLPRLLDLYGREGVRFAPLETVQADPFYLDDTRALASPAPISLGAPAPAAMIARLDALCR